MSLRYYFPQSALQPHVQSFGIIEESQTVFNNRTILADSHPAVLINLGAPFVWEMGNGVEVELPRAFFIRMQTRTMHLRATGPCHTIGLNLAAWGSRLLLDESVNLTESPIIALDKRWQDFAQLMARTVDKHGDLEAVATFEQFAADLHLCARLDISSIRTAVELLSDTNGRYNLNALAARCYLSSSQFERHSKYFTGLTPKLLARLIRFDASCGGLLNDPQSRLTDLAHKYGFVDQSHFVHEFRAFADCTPREARTYVRQLAADAEILQFS